MNAHYLQKNLIRLRKDANMTQKDLSKALNYSDKVISKWERGDSLPNIDALSIIASYFNVSIDSLLGHEIENKQATTFRTTQLDLIKVESPSFWRYLFIVPNASVALIFAFTGSDLFGPAMILLGFAIIIYTFLLSKASFETRYNDLSIRVENRASSLKAFVNDTCLVNEKNLLKVNPVYTAYHDDYIIHFQLSNVTSIKCNAYLEYVQPKQQ